MSQPTIDEARESLKEAELRYLGIETSLNNTPPGVPTPERVLREVELRAALEEAARELVESKARYEEVERTTNQKRRARAAIDLAKTETDLVGAVQDGEQSMDTLVGILERVLDLSKKRFAHRREATGTATRSHLGRSVVAGWVLYRLGILELRDLPSAGHHHRAPLIELLGLESNTDEQVNDEEGPR